MTNLRDWLSTSFWPDVAAGQPINTKQITKRLETYPAGPAGLAVGEGLHAGWNVETRDQYYRIPCYMERTVSRSMESTPTLSMRQSTATEPSLKSKAVALYRTIA